MRDQVFIEGLQATTCIGVYEWERELRQRVVMDVDLYVALDAAGSSDDLRQTVDYKSVSDLLVGLVESARYELLESLADALVSAVLEQFAVDAVGLRLSKPGAVPAASNVGVRIYHERTTR